MSAQCQTLANAKIRIEHRQWAAAAHALAQFLTDDPHHYEALTLLAMCKWQLDDVDGTAGLANQLIHTLPGRGLGYYLKAQVLHHAGADRQALSVVQKALRCDPNNPESLGLMCRIQLQLHDRKAAAMTARYLRAMNPHHPLGQALVEQTTPWLASVRNKLRQGSGAAARAGGWRVIVVAAIKSWA